MPKPDNKTLVIVAVCAGALAFLFFSRATLADVFFFIAGVVGILAYYRAIQLRDELENVKQQIDDKIEELNVDLNKLKQKLDKA